jgi:hypothetical protein
MPKAAETALDGLEANLYTKQTNYKHMPEFNNIVQRYQKAVETIQKISDISDDPSKSAEVLKNKKEEIV